VKIRRRWEFRPILKRLGLYYPGFGWQRAPIQEVKDHWVRKHFGFERPNALFEFLFSAAKRYAAWPGGEKAIRTVDQTVLGGPRSKNITAEGRPSDPHIAL
jgi:hypothetical protein